MIRAVCRFYAELNDFLPADRRGRRVLHRCPDARSVKDLIESLGVPHPEVVLILVNGRSVGFDHQVQDNDRIAVYPASSPRAAKAPGRLGPAPLDEPRFILDVHLGRLARYLRLAGFDALYRNDWSDEELAVRSRDGHRILLTRDRELLKRSVVVHGSWMRDTDAERQLVEVLRRYRLADRVAPFRRCVRCNERLETVAKPAVRHRLPQRTCASFEEFRRCPGCDRLYWAGSHVDRLKRLLSRAVAGAKRRGS